jgi:hypothetical protein
MGVSAFPRRGGVQFDARNDGRALRVSAHPESGSMVLSIWRGDQCVATHHVAAADVPDLIKMLAAGLVHPTQMERIQAS